MVSPPPRSDREGQAERPPAVTGNAELQARGLAEHAASRSGVTITGAQTVEDLRQVLGVVERIWAPAPEDPPITLAVLRALVHSGSQCTLARSGDQVVGVCIGFLASNPPRSLHSHITGVTEAAAGRSVGFALKLDQRAWALEQGLDTITWTFDPLIRRNAYVNLVKLGAGVDSYLDDFYGEMADRINTGQGSDRLLARWDLLAPRVVAACWGRPYELDLAAEQAAGATVAVEVVGDGPSDPVEVPAGRMLVQVPSDIEGLRVASPALAARWRSAVRVGLGGALRRGWVVSGMAQPGWYVLDPAAVIEEPQ